MVLGYFDNIFSAYTALSLLKYFFLESCFVLVFDFEISTIGPYIRNIWALAGVT